MKKVCFVIILWIIIYQNVCWSLIIVQYNWICVKIKENDVDIHYNLLELKKMTGGFAGMSGKYCAGVESWQLSVESV